MRIHDISPLISTRLSVWPGDTGVSREVLCDMARGDNITLSTLRATVHLGSHADAPSHYGAGAATIESADLSLYVGACRVVRVSVGRGERVSRGMFEEGLSAESPSAGAGRGGAIRLPERVLIATGTYADAEDWNGDFAGLSVELVDFLHGRGVRLVGVDTPSVDLSESKDLPAHQAFLRNGMMILEGLVLAGIAAGEYELIALPLKLEGFDGSPVRAVLREVGNQNK